MLGTTTLEGRKDLVKRLSGYNRLQMYESHWRCSQIDIGGL